MAVPHTAMIIETPLFPITMTTSKQRWLPASGATHRVQRHEHRPKMEQRFSPAARKEQITGSRRQGRDLFAVSGCSMLDRTVTRTAYVGEVSDRGTMLHSTGRLPSYSDCHAARKAMPYSSSGRRFFHNTSASFCASRICSEVSSSLSVCRIVSSCSLFFLSVLLPLYKIKKV